eukprot:16449817-Heterocapsa_arctica.AAC.1
MCLVTRLRLLAHLSDHRRPKCWNVIRSSPLDFDPLPEASVVELDLKDREARKAAKKQGRTHPVAVGLALTAKGKFIGHVRH